jgi:hypothetical protein
MVWWGLLDGGLLRRNSEQPSSPTSRFSEEMRRGCDMYTMIRGAKNGYCFLLVHHGAISLFCRVVLPFAPFSSSGLPQPMRSALVSHKAYLLTLLHPWPVHRMRAVIMPPIMQRNQLKFTNPRVSQESGTVRTVFGPERVPELQQGCWSGLSKNDIRLCASCTCQSSRNKMPEGTCSHQDVCVFG